MRILLVDDDRNILAATRRLLERAGHHVDPHDAVDAALAAFAIAPLSFDGAVLDVNIGEGDGVALATELRAIRPDLRIAFATGSTQSAERARAHGEVLAKPFAPNDLVAMLDRWRR